MKVAVTLLFVSLPLSFSFSESSDHNNNNNNKCVGFLAAFPFFKEDAVEARYQPQQLALLIEFARFLNNKAPSLLKAFVTQKSVFQSKATLSQVRSLHDQMSNFADLSVDPIVTLNNNNNNNEDNVDEDEPYPEFYESGETVGRTAAVRNGTGVAGLAAAIVQSTDAFINATEEIIDALDEAIDDFFSLDFWGRSCPRWWPVGDSTCGEMRCTACAPAVATAGKVCNAIGKDNDHKCIQKMMGDGYCNFCIVEYVQ